MTKGRIINAIFVLSVLGAALSIYLFYFKEKLETYAHDEQLGRQLDTALKGLEEDFSGRKPEWISAEWRSNIPTWKSIINSRAKYYSYGDEVSDIPQPEEERTLKFWYDEAMREMILDFYRTKVNKSIRPDLFPEINQFLSEVRVETLDQWTGMDIDINHVNIQLTNLAFGFAAANLLLDHNVTSISSMVCLPPVVIQAHGGITEKRTIDTEFTMTAQSLVELLEAVRTSDRFFTIEGVKVEYPYIGYNVEPQLQVAMLITQVAFNNKKLEAATSSSPTTLAAAFDRSVGRRVPGGGRDVFVPQKRSIFYRGWRWFKRVYLASN